MYAILYFKNDYLLQIDESLKTGKSIRVLLEKAEEVHEQAKVDQVFHEWYPQLLEIERWPIETLTIETIIDYLDCALNLETRFKLDCDILGSILPHVHEDAYLFNFLKYGSAKENKPETDFNKTWLIKAATAQLLILTIAELQAYMQPYCQNTSVVSLLNFFVEKCPDRTRREMKLKALLG